MELNKYLCDKNQEHTQEELMQMMENYISIKQQIKELEEKQKILLEGMVALTDSQGGVINGHKLYKTVKNGSVAYKKIVEEHLPKIDLEPYKGSPTEYWSVK